MVLCLVRCCRFQHLKGFQKNIRKHGLPSLVSCDSKALSTRLTSHCTGTLNNHIRHNRLELKYSETGRPFHTSISLLKMIKEDYETWRILYPDGKFLCNAEVYLLKRFCLRYKRYGFKEVEPDSEKATTVDMGDGKFKVFLLFDKLRGKSGARKESRTKIIQFHHEATAKNEKMDQILETLVNEGKVTVTFDQKSKVGGEVLKILKEFNNVKVVVSVDNRVYFVKVDEVSGTMLQKLFEDVQLKEAKHLAQVKDLLKTMEEQ